MEINLSCHHQIADGVCLDCNGPCTHQTANGVCMDCEWPDTGKPRCQEEYRFRHIVHERCGLAEGHAGLHRSFGRSWFSGEGK